MAVHRTCSPPPSNLWAILPDSGRRRRQRKRHGAAIKRRPRDQQKSSIEAIGLSHSHSTTSRRSSLLLLTILVITMQLTSLLALAAAVSSALAVTVSYDETYDNPSGDMLTVSCSNGPHGLVPQGFPTFGSLPSFPNIGGAAAVAGFDSAQCGTCWQLTYAGTGKSINVLAIDHAGAGFNIALEAMNTLTDGQGVFLGRIDADVQQVDASKCGL